VFSVGMKIKGLNIDESLSKAKRVANSASANTSDLRGVIDLLVTILELLVGVIGQTSRNSHKPPSQDPFRKKRKRGSTSRKPGGQPNRVGKTLSQVPDPDEIVAITIDRRTLPRGETFTASPQEKRQVVDVRLDVVVTEYQAEVLVDSKGRRHTAAFPAGVNAPVQYGSSVRGMVTYLSSFQMLPFLRIRDYFEEHFGLPISAGTLVAIREEAGRALADFVAAAHKALLTSYLVFCDETGINVAGKNRWLHCISSQEWTLLLPHEKRGTEAMDGLGFLDIYKGIVMHDNWQSYFKYQKCEHALCNAHHLRELESAKEEGQLWAAKMIAFLSDLNKEVTAAGGALSQRKQANRRIAYRKVLRSGQRECPLAPSSPDGKRGRKPQSKPRNLLNRLIEREDETLRFMTDARVPFTNNQGERDQRMTKVKQKISGTYRTLESATDDLRLRSFISTCQKQGVSVAQALADLHRGILPEFVTAQLRPTT